MDTPGASSPEPMKELNLPGGKTMSAGVTEQTAAKAKKPLIMEMKDKPPIETEYLGDSVRVVVHVEKETSAKDIDLDIAETELKLESKNYELRYKFENGVHVDPDSVRAKFSKTKHTLTLSIDTIKS